MNRFAFIAVISALGLTGCFSPDPATPVATQNGQNVYQTTCDVAQNALGGKAIYGPNKGKRVTKANYCKQISVTCPSGANVLNISEGAPRLVTATHDNGGYRYTRRYYVRPTTVRYTCQA